MVEIIQSATFHRWRSALRDRQAVARINARIRRLAEGNPGDVKSLRDGISELRIDHGPGYRVYFGRDGDVLVILLAGGTKKRQQQDIRAAQARWAAYKRHKRLAR